MTEKQAIQLIAKGIGKGKDPQRWADLGCGAGIFTRALAALLPPGSMIYAVDKNPQRLAPAAGNTAAVEFLQLDFENYPLPFSNLNGIIMANALHYISKKKKCLLRLEQHFGSSPRFLIIEYDTVTANPWVPFPIDFAGMQTLFLQLGYQRIEKLATRRSAFGNYDMYASRIQK